MGDRHDNAIQASASFFQNTACEYFPCHEGVDEACFNCLFCYCPLYALGRACGGNCHYTETGVKCCEHCPLPHDGDSFAQIVAERLFELNALSK